jgi:hypothetical protein
MSNDGKPFDGPRIDNVDYFDDIMGDNSAPAIFDGQGFQQYERVQATPNKNGIMILMPCRACGRDKRIDITWPEVFIVAHAPRTNIIPNGWDKSQINQAPYPKLSCDSCQALCGPIIQPDWAMQRIDGALRAGLVSPEALQQDPQVRFVAAAIARQQQQQMPQQGYVGPDGQRYG